MYNKFKNELCKILNDLPKYSYMKQKIFVIMSKSLQYQFRKLSIKKFKMNHDPVFGDKRFFKSIKPIAILVKC